MQLCRTSARRAQCLALTASTDNRRFMSCEPHDCTHTATLHSNLYYYYIFLNNLMISASRRSSGHSRSSIKHIKQQSEDRTTALYSFNWYCTKLISGGIYSINTKESAYVTLFSPVSFFFHYLNRNSLGPSIPQPALTENRSINTYWPHRLLPSQLVKDKPSWGHCTNYILQFCTDSG